MLKVYDLCQSEERRVSVSDVFSVALNEYGLLQVDWSDLGFWQFIACRELQSAAIDEANSKLGAKRNG